MSLVQDILSFAAKNGYKAFRIEGHDTFGYLITPDDNVLSVNKGTWGGVTFTFDYQPSKEHGQGCSCNDSDEAIFDIPTVAELKGLEMAGKNFAKELMAKFYENRDQWFESNYWQKQGLIKEVA